MAHLETGLANTLTILVSVGGVEVASNGKRIYPVGGPDNSPIARAVLIADRFAKPFAASQRIEDPELQSEVQSILGGQLRDAMPEMSASAQLTDGTGHKFTNCPLMLERIKLLKHRLAGIRNLLQRETLEDIIASDEEIYRELCEHHTPSG